MTLTASSTYNCNKAVWYVNQYMSTSAGTLTVTSPGGTSPGTTEYKSFSIHNN